jgi:hypothetical protein
MRLDGGAWTTIETHTGPIVIGPPVPSVNVMGEILHAALAAVPNGPALWSSTGRRHARNTGSAWRLLARQPLWRAGAALEVGAFAAHAAALSSGPLAAVQLILDCSLIVSLVVSARGFPPGAARAQLAGHAGRGGGSRRQGCLRTVA